MSSVSSPVPPSKHQPVLLAEVIDWLAPIEGAVLVDGTVGAGGHAAELARRIGPSGRLLGLDRDPEMLALAADTLRGLAVTLIHAPYSRIGEILAEQNLAGVNGILLDLGMSSNQLGWNHRGFSFAHDGPLDMRFDPNEAVTAADIVNTYPEKQLADILFEFGDERFSRRVARRIVEERRVRGPITTTARLAQIVRRSIPGRRGSIDPATRSFQALRIEVNQELAHLDTALSQASQWLIEGGRVAVICFHSLEDRRVKFAFREDPRLTVLTRKPITATAEEIRTNPRARSAKLRVAERCTKPTPPRSKSRSRPR